jgi:hypothetical protein
MVCQLRPLVWSLGLNNPPRTGMYLAPGESCVKNLWHNKQETFRCKMPGTGTQSFAELHRQIVRGMPTTTLQWTAECQIRGKFCPRNATDWATPLVNCPRNATNSPAVLCPWHSAAHIWARNVTLDWNPAPAILHRESPCLSVISFCRSTFRI